MSIATLHSQHAILPQIGVVMEVPDLLISSRKLKKAQVEIFEEVITELLVWYWRKRVPDHFKQTARHKYSYKGRHPDYKRAKKRARRGITDLVFGGDTRTAMTKTFPKITFPKKGRTGGTMTGRAKLARFPFPLSREYKKTGVTPETMADEIARWTDDEKREVADLFSKKYVQKFRALLAVSPRWRKKLGPQFKPFMA